MEFNFRELDTAAGSVLGIRRWRTSAGYLQGAIGHLWWPREEYKACCHLLGDNLASRIITLFRGRHRVPAKDCKCGFYAYWSPSVAAYDNLPVSGVIEGYGKTIVGTRGFRSEFCKIRAIQVSYISYLQAAQLSMRYEVPVYPTIEVMLRDFPLTKDYFSW